MELELKTTAFQTVLTAECRTLGGHHVARYTRMVRPADKQKESYLIMRIT